MASAGHIVPPARGGSIFSARGPLTSQRLLWHNVTRRPRRGILGFLSPRFSSPVAADAFLSVFSGLAGSGLVLLFPRPLKGSAEKQNKNAASALGFRVVFCFVFPWQNKTTSASSRSAEVVLLFVFFAGKQNYPSSSPPPSVSGRCTNLVACIPLGWLGSLSQRTTPSAIAVSTASLAVFSMMP